MTQRRLTGCIAAGTLIIIGLYGCVWPADILAGLEDLEDAEPISTFDGEWLGVDFAYAIEIVDRIGTVVQSNTFVYHEGDPILAIVEADGNRFNGRHLFTDGFVREVIGSLTTPDTITLSGGGFVWTLERFKTNIAPTADPQLVNVEEDTPTEIVLTGSDPDAGPGALTFELDSLPINGRLAGTPPTVTYTPAAGFVGNDSFTFTASDGKDTSAPASILIAVGEPDE